MTIDDRKTGWLTPQFYYKFRELLTHTLFRYAINCPIYCCMPDHIHMMWLGLSSQSDQLNAMKFLRRQTNIVLQKLNCVLQSQGYDNVLREDERSDSAFAQICEYIARNPERDGLVAVDEFRLYKFTDCLIPGAPEVHFNDDQFWTIFWRIHSAMAKNGVLKMAHSSEP